MTPNKVRYVGLDVHKHYVMVGAVDQYQQVLLPPRKVSLLEFEGWAQKYLRPTDEVVLEATTNAWYIHNLVEPLVGRVVVTHPPHIKLIAAAMLQKIGLRFDQRITLANAGGDSLLFTLDGVG